MADKNLDGSGLSEVWVRAAQLVKKYTGAVDSTKGDLQTQVNEKLSGTDDTKDNVVSFTSGDTANPTVWKDVEALASNENHKSILEKISNMFNNIRYLYKNVGGIKGLSSSAAITTQGEYALDAREKNASVDGTLANEINKLNSNLINDFNSIITNLNTTTCHIGLVNGWDISNNVGVPSDFTGMYGTFIQVFNWITDRLSDRKQILIGQNAQIWTREYISYSNTFTEWVSSFDKTSALINDRIKNIGTVYTGNPIETQISGAYKQDVISEVITLPPGTYVFSIMFKGKIVASRQIMVSLMQDYNNLATWSFVSKEKSTAYGAIAQSYTYIHTISSSLSFKVAYGCNWISDDDDSTAQALLQAIRIA